MFRPITTIISLAVLVAIGGGGATLAAVDDSRTVSETLPAYLVDFTNPDMTGINHEVSRRPISPLDKPQL